MIFMEKVDNMGEQMSNESKKMELLRKNKKMLKIKNCNRNEEYLLWGH